MTNEFLYQAFKYLGITLVVFIAGILYSMFFKDKQLFPKLTKYLTVSALLVFLTMVIIIVLNAKTAEVTRAISPDDLHNSSIYNIVFYTLTYFARTTIFSVVIGAFIYLLFQSKRYDKNLFYAIHKLLLSLGIIFVASVYIIDILKTLKDVEYANVISFGSYTRIFVGGIFWMFICSIYAAIGSPVDKHQK